MYVCIYIYVYWTVVYSSSIYTYIAVEDTYVIVVQSMETREVELFHLLYEALSY
jgi:hypothetical protein